jgi:hypothetical protein
MKPIVRLGPSPRKSTYPPCGSRGTTVSVDDGTQTRKGVQGNDTLRCCGVDMRFENY